VHKEASRRLVLDENLRLDGRRPDQIRSITCEIDPLPATHGSALFTRGETQSLTTVTPRNKLDERSSTMCSIKVLKNLPFITTFRRSRPVMPNLPVV